MMINNPFKNTVEEIKDCKKVYILCLKNGIDEIDDFFDKDKLNNQKYKEYINKMVLIEGSYYMLKNKTHKQNCSLVSKKDIQQFNHYKLNLDEFNYVINIYNISENDIKLYLQLYNSFNLEEYFKVNILSDYFNCNVDNFYINHKLENLIKNLGEIVYWKNENNCKLNMTKPFINRGFNLKLKTDDNKEIQKAIQNILDNNNKDINYLQYIYRKDLYVDASSAITRDGYRIYKINNDTINFEYEQINEIFRNVNDEQQYYLFNYMLVSKKYCHLVINNSYILDKMNNIISNFKIMYKYLFGYTWLTLYLEECIKKTMTSVKDRFVFDIHTASKLPFFPYCQTNIHMNPYTCVLVNRDVINYENNFKGLPMIVNYQHYGISTMQQFKHNFNIFTTSNPNKSILDGVNWNNIAVTGSTMTACIPKRSPLVDLFNYNTEDLKLDRYFDEYYHFSDIDIMFNDQSMFKYIDKVYHIHDIVKNNLTDMKKNNELKIIPFKKVAIIISVDYINKNIV
jgi:hypothetical protein